MLSRKSFIKNDELNLVHGAQRRGQLSSVSLGAIHTVSSSFSWSFCTWMHIYFFFRLTCCSSSVVYTAKSLLFLLLQQIVMAPWLFGKLSILRLWTDVNTMVRGDELIYRLATLTLRVMITSLGISWNGLTKLCGCRDSGAFYCFFNNATNQE